MIIKEYNNYFQDLWDSFIDNSKNGLFMFKRNYMEYHSDRFVDNSLLFFDENDELFALLPASLDGTTLLSHGGLTFGGIIANNKMKQAHMNEIFSLLINYMRNKNIKSLLYKVIPHIYHKQPAEEDLYSLFINSAHLVKNECSSVIDLKNRLKMPKGRKSQISKAKREGVIVLDSNNFEEFISLENEVLQKYHNVSAVHTASELRLLYEYFPKNIRLVVGIKNEQIISGALLFIYDQVVHTQYLAANDLAREIGALDLVINTIIEEYQESKKWFDFGKSTENDGRVLNKGLISQKEGFGGRTFVYQTYKIDI